MKKIVFVLFLSLSTFLSAQKELKNIDAKLDSIFGHYNNGITPGVSIAIIEKNKPTYLKSYGHANLEYQIKNTSGTLFNATDLAKQFTVFSILFLQDQGKLNINDNIKKYLPELSGWPFEITLKHLMEQTSGLRDVMELRKWKGYENGDVITKQDILDTAAKQKRLHFSVGNKFEYNRTGFVLLTEVIAKVSGKPFSEFVDQHIFTPLRMNASMFVNTHTELVQNRSYSYATTDTKFTKIVNNSSFIGGTNLYTSTADFAKWLRNMSEQSIGKPTFYHYMNTKIELPDGQSSNYTPGIFKDDSNGYWRIHLEGFDHGYTSYMMYLPAYDFSMVFFSNDVMFSPDDIYDSVFDWFNTDYKVSPVKAVVTQNVKFITKSATELQDYVGSYLFEDNFSFRKVVLENDTLYYTRDETKGTPMVPVEGNHAFKMLVPGNDNIRVTFKNQFKTLEFRAVNNARGYPDYFSLGKKFKFDSKKQKACSNEYRNEALGHTVSLQNTKQGIQLWLDGTSILLRQIGDDEFLALENPKVKHVKLERDKQLGSTGLLLSNGQIKNLYYKKVSK
ncbi:MAG: serine hydrolase domain-containing protein [Maribacter sp.]